MHTTPAPFFSTLNLQASSSEPLSGVIFKKITYSRLFNVSSHHSKNLTLTLPLVQDFRRILFPVGSRRFPSSSAPAFHLHVYSRRCLTRSELASWTHNFHHFSAECFLNSPRLASSGYWANSVCSQPLQSITTTLVCGAAFTVASNCLFKFRYPRYL